MIFDIILAILCQGEDTDACQRAWEEDIKALKSDPGRRSKLSLLDRMNLDFLDKTE